MTVYFHLCLISLKHDVSNRGQPPIPLRSLSVCPSYTHHFSAHRKWLIYSYKRHLFSPFILMVSVRLMHDIIHQSTLSVYWWHLTASIGCFSQVFWSADVKPNGEKSYFAHRGVNSEHSMWQRVLMCGGSSACVFVLSIHTNYAVYLHFSCICMHLWG